MNSLPPKAMDNSNEVEIGFLIELVISGEADKK